MTLPFQNITWTFIFAQMLVFSVLFFTIFTLYSEWKLTMFIGYVTHGFDFILLTFTSMFEPDPIPWFTSKWSTGKFLITLWSVFAFLINLCYVCNLRAVMITTSYEKPINTPTDVLERGEAVYLAKEALLFWPNEHTEMAEDVKVEWLKVVDLVLKHNGAFSLVEHGGRPDYAIKDIMENGASTLCQG